MHLPGKIVSLSIQLGRSLDMVTNKGDTVVGGELSWKNNNNGYVNLILALFSLRRYSLR